MAFRETRLVLSSQTRKSYRYTSWSYENKRGFHNHSVSEYPVLQAFVKTSLKHKDPLITVEKIWRNESELLNMSMFSDFKTLEERGYLPVNFVLLPAVLKQKKTNNSKIQSYSRGRVCVCELKWKETAWDFNFPKIPLASAKRNSQQSTLKSHW